MTTCDVFEALWSQTAVRSSDRQSGVNDVVHGVVDVVRQSDVQRVVSSHSSSNRLVRQLVAGPTTTSDLQYTYVISRRHSSSD